MPANQPPNHTAHIAQIGQLADLVRQRREYLGLTQARLGALAGLSRATINELETGELVDLGIAKVLRLLDVLGIELQLAGTSQTPRAARRKPGALATAARTASTSYRDALPPATLASALRTGEIPLQYRAHIASLLDEAPVPLVVRAVEESFATSVPRSSWKHIAAWAAEFKSTREAWH